MTAASGGIAGAVVRTLIDEGVRVLGADRTVTTALKETGALTVEADLTSAEGVEKVRHAAESELGGVDLLVNGVGGLAGLPVGGLADTEDETWQKAFELNFFATMRVTRALEALLREAVVSISTGVARWPTAGPNWYGSSKAALSHFSKGLADELGPRGIRVNTVSPGLMVILCAAKVSPSVVARGRGRSDRRRWGGDRPAQPAATSRGRGSRRHGRAPPVPYRRSTAGVTGSARYMSPAMGWAGLPSPHVG
ncbi:SDR family NAD(P)-dependent oxidoreductase [Thermomonospora umbrina]|uniref:SDR family NAD(P)-dependent oxidoreductase n=1 Tax=Thermomonospora umbrina TaxID=111806 RepID=UPI0014770124|nr:SDR family NAD(P)-dependent oxidoreductase [Thermomonospora umbrina]